MLKRFARYYKPHMKLFVLDLIASFFIGMADTFMPLIVRRMINQYVPLKEFDMIIRWSWGLLVIYLVKFLLNLFVNYWGHIVGVRIQADMRRELFEHLEHLPISFFDHEKTGAIMSRITNDLQEISEMAHHGPENLFICTVMLIVSCVMLGRINTKLTIIVFATLPLAVLFVILIRKKQMDAFAQARAKVGGINADVEASISGIRVTRSYDGVQTEMNKFDRANAEYVTARSAAYKYLALFNSGMLLFTDLMYVIVVYFGGRFFAKGYINAGDFVAYLLYISMFLTPVKKLVATYEQIAEGMSGFQRFTQLIDMPIEQDEEGAIDAGILNGDIVFDHVDFHYESESEESVEVIQDLSLSIKQGQTVALVGESGGGKTTICNLIPRFYEVDRGEIRIDGTDITKFTRDSLRRNIGIVAQDVFLFNGTIRDNIAYGRFDATEEEIIEAAKKAEIHEDILKMPNGYDSIVGERGMHLSGGQRQRISIARVFLKNPRILILDEATSALDNATEMAIQKSLDELSKGRTVLVVAHRLSTIRNAEKIFVLTRDGIVEEGSSDELLAQNGIYAKLYQYQFEGKQA